MLVLTPEELHRVLEAALFSAESIFDGNFVKQHKAEPGMKSDPEWHRDVAIAALH